MSGTAARCRFRANAQPKPAAAIAATMTVGSVGEEPTSPSEVMANIKETSVPRGA